MDIHSLLQHSSISQVQQLHETIKQLRGEVDEVKAKTSVWKQKMDDLASEKEAARAHLSITEIVLQGMKEKNFEQAKKIDELQDRLDTEIAATKSEAETAKADAEAIMVYRPDTNSAQVRAKEVVDAAENTRLLSMSGANLKERLLRRFTLVASTLLSRSRRQNT